MWIRRQDKRRLLEVKDFLISEITNPEHKFFKGCSIEGNGKNLGCYSSEAKALKVFDIIQAHLTKNEAGIYNSKFGVYQMPADDDVIVFERHDNMEVKDNE